MREVAERVIGCRVAGAAHWIPEENPHRLVEALLGFLDGREADDPRS